MHDRVSQMKTFGLWTLPNAITSLRIVAAIPIIWMLVSEVRWALWLALAIMVLAEFTDWLDGFLARRTQQVSKAGKIFDPMADSLYRIAVFTAFAANHWMPIWMILIIVSRDVGVSYLRVLAEQASKTMAARQSGKWKAVFQGAAQLTVVFVYAAFGPDLSAALHYLLTGALLVATAVTAYSMVDYFMGFRELLKSED